MTEQELEQMREWERLQMEDQAYEAEEFLAEWRAQRAMSE